MTEILHHYYCWEDGKSTNKDFNPCRPCKVFVDDEEVPLVVRCMEGDPGFVEAYQQGEKENSFAINSDGDPARVFHRGRVEVQFS
jgi:hypothetical protein